MARIDPPGFLDDFSDAQKDQWSEIVSGWLDDARQGNPAENDGPRGQFFNPLTNPPGADTQVAIISWNAFPRQARARGCTPWRFTARIPPPCTVSPRSRNATFSA